MQKIISISYQRSIVEGIVCSKRWDSGERCEVKKAMKSRGGLGRQVRERVPSLTSPPPSLLFFSRSFLLRTSPHYPNAWNRLWRAVHECPAYPIPVIELQSFEFGNRLRGGGVLPYMSYIAMCNPIEYGFAPFWSENGYRFCPFWSWIGCGFHYDSVWTYS